MASEHFIHNRETSDESPDFQNIMKYKMLIYDNLPYLRRQEWNGYYYIAFLPQGDIGYDNHEYEVIKDLEDVKGALNEIVSQIKK